jgi:plastocyanin
MKRIVIIIAAFLVATLGFGHYLSVRGHATEKHMGHDRNEARDSESRLINVDSREATNAITIDNFSFSPAVMTVAAGTTVTWTNRDDIPHTVVQQDQKFKSKAMDTDDSFSYTFTEPGTYEYFCSLHPKMTAKIIVKDK